MKTPIDKMVAAAERHPQFTEQLRSMDLEHRKRNVEEIRERLRTRSDPKSQMLLKDIDAIHSYVEMQRLGQLVNA